MIDAERGAAGGAGDAASGRDRWALKRADYLILRAALVLVALGAVGYLVPTLVDWISGAPLQVQSATSEVAPAVAGVVTRDGATATYAQQVDWSLPNASPVLWLLALVPKLMTSAVVVAGVVLVWRLLTAVQRGAAFGGSALRTVRALGVLVLAWAAAVPLIAFAANVFTVFEARVEPQFEFVLAPWSLTPFVVGLLVVALGEVFRLGSRLQDDVEGLV